ncbi:MAG: hypothetical protein HFH56_07635 [Lachnospiraceae bacterium]|jgi:hypothetical protein|nr:hypothetical protein [Lachnospiraceae bacterium]
MEKNGARALVGIRVYLAPFFTMKVPENGRKMGKLVCTLGLTFDGLTCMNE